MEDNTRPSTVIKPLFSWRSAVCDSDLPPGTRLVAFGLSFYMSERGDSAFPGAVRLARDTGLSERSVRAHLKELVDKGWLAVIEHGGIKGERRRANSYQASVPLQPVQGSEDAPLQPATLTPATVAPLPLQPLHPNSSLISPKNSPSIPQAGFDDFWRAYPRRVGKRAASKAWDSATKREAPAFIVGAAVTYAERRRGQDPQFTPHPATWLNRDGWLDEPEQTGPVMSKSTLAIARWLES